MLDKLKMLIQVLKGNAIVIQRLSEDDIKVECGKHITKDFATRSVITTLSKLR